jgi:quercetin dioxygenase-like cupin family protein
MILRAKELEEKEGRRVYPIKSLQKTIGHFVTRRTTKDNPFGPHKHDGKEFWYILKGKGKVLLDGEESIVEEGDLIVLQPWKEHGLTSEEGVDWICFG